jgi:2-haloacid dehalogenase
VARAPEEDDMSTPIDRRRFLDLAATGVAASAFGSALQAAESPRTRFRAVAFDAFPVFDPRPIAALAETLFPGKGNEIVNAWRTRQFEYQWLRTLSGRYADFWQTTLDGLTYAAKLLRLELTPEARDRLMNAYLGLKAWPDAPAALRALRAAGLRLVFTSNMTAKLLDASIANSGLGGVFDAVLSTDRVKAHKPHPRAYAMAEEALNMRRDEILFAAFAGWDAAGAKAFGYPTFWVNRLGLPAEELGIGADAQGKDLDDLLKFAVPNAA